METMGTVAHATAAPRHTPAPLPPEPRSRRRRTAPGQTQGAHPRPQRLQTRTIQRIRDAGGGGAEKGMHRGGEEGRGQSRREDLENKARNHCQPAWAHQKPRCWAPCREGAAHAKAYQEARVSSTHANTHDRVASKGRSTILEFVGEAALFGGTFQPGKVVSTRTNRCKIDATQLSSHAVYN